MSVTTIARGFDRLARVGLMALAVTLLAGPAAAQDDPNGGAMTFTGGFDILPGSTYVFRGIVQERDAGLTLWPSGDLGIALFSGDGGVKSVGVNFGVWNSLHSGTAGSDGPGRMHYEMDFYSTLTLGFGGGYSLGTTYTAYTSPNGSFDTVNELSFRVSRTHRLAPYGILAFELDDAGQADVGASKGTYLELGIGPSFPLGTSTATLTIPVKLGFSVTDYYENPLTGEDEKFGFFDVGGLITLPIGGIPSRFGTWNFHAGFDLLLLGDTTEFFNAGDNVKATGLIGIGLSY